MPRRRGDEPLALAGNTLRLLLYNVFRGLLIATCRAPTSSPRAFEDTFTELATTLAQPDGGDVR